MWPHFISRVIQCESESQMNVGIGFGLKYETDLATADARDVSGDWVAEGRRDSDLIWLTPMITFTPHCMHTRR